MNIVVLLIACFALGLITIHFLLMLFTPHPIPITEEEKTYTTLPDSAPQHLPALSDPASIALSIVVPAYNEELRLGTMLDEVVEYLTHHKRHHPRQPENSGTPKFKDGAEIIVVDDGSSDSTTKVAERLAASWAKYIDGKGIDIRVVTLRTNRGKGGAVQHGVVHARGRLILFADADGATRFADLDNLLEAMEKIKDKDGHGIVIGSRAHLVKSEAVVKRSKVRNALMHGFHLFLRTIGVGGIRDTQCGFKLFTRPTAQLLFPTLHLHRWAFDVELLLLASLVVPPIPVVEIPVAWEEVDGSKIRLGWDSIGMARDLLVLRGNLLFGKWIVPGRAKVESGKVNGHAEVTNGI
ncbi:glycosyltransferase family 2 protein [Kockovaella imperatae]|uniref:dolichyl-phosphate beta-glucosyltransferase n=1 Tax=Kockovaella imperatae TaxID=4999 RepID=A0A1Y1UIQ6_9TREE|nr:glycosyltransferase family 2 protein [Kockovaella imperatae]ORX37930.1 glycosyltransferase family 2 protein [Kockovaella imperatae]